MVLLCFSFPGDRKQGVVAYLFALVARFSPLFISLFLHHEEIFEKRSHLVQFPSVSMYSYTFIPAVLSWYLFAAVSLPFSTLLKYEVSTNNMTSCKIPIYCYAAAYAMMTFSERTEKCSST